MNLWVIFLTGLTTGGLTCVAVQGGLLMSVIANVDQKVFGKKTTNTGVKKYLVPVLLFLSTKLFAHILLGFLLGALGSVVTLSLGVRLFFQAFSGLFMFATAMNLLDVHPIFRFVVIQPPRFIGRFIYKYSKDSESFFAPAVLGLLTVLIPCGVTQAMEVLAINTGDPVAGATLMAAFVLGTIPLFSLIALAAAKLSESWKKTFYQVAATVLILVAVSSLNGVLEVLDAPITGSKIVRAWNDFWTPTPLKNKNLSFVKEIDGVSKVTIDVNNTGYSPSYIRVKKGVPVELTLRTNKTYSCAVDFHLKAFGIREFLQPVGEKTVAFTPKQSGKFSFSCGMGMYTGVVEVL